jgi:hypothetical protein
MQTLIWDITEIYANFYAFISSYFAVTQLGFGEAK